MEKNKKIEMKNFINSEQVKKAKEILLYVGNFIKELFKNKKNDPKTTIFIAIIIVIFAIYRGITLYQTISEVSQNPSSLEKVTQYNLDSLKTNALTRNDLATATTIYDLIQNNEDTISEIERYNKYKENLLYPYTNFLQHLLLPKLNIRKDPYTNEINTNILGKSFLDENPYNDINLLQKRTDFFSSTNQNEINQINDIKISEINKYENGIFGINIAFSFIAPSKNALLFLTDKITTTSDQENISLLGEFFYHLRQQIKTDKKEYLEEQNKNGIFSGENNIDKNIGYELYNWIFNDDSNELLENTTINRAIFSMMGCSPETEIQCFYKFRDKYRNIATLAYTVGIKDNQNKVEDLKYFLKNLAPTMAVKSFYYTKINDTSIVKQNTNKFEGKIELEFYGQNISSEEIDEIATKLGEQCLSEKIKISAEEALKIIDETIRKKANIMEENKNQSNNIRDLKIIIENINSDFESLSNYKKTIRLFEIYRMLNENGLCKTI